MFGGTMIKVSEEDVSRIMELTAEMKSIRYIPTRKKELADAIERMNSTEKWFLTFCSWHCLFNSRFKAIGAERLCLYEPSSRNGVTFQTFLDFLRRFNGKRLSPSRQAPMLKLLGECDSIHREFYLSLLTKEWVRSFPVTEIQNLLDLDSISGEKVYGELEYLKTPFDGLSYPVSLRRVSTEKLTPYLMVKEPLSSSLYVDKGIGYRRVEKTEEVATDLTLSTYPRFVVSGVFDSTTYYPTDYFRSWEDCVNYLTGRPHEYGFANHRVGNLNYFLDRNMMIHSDTTESVIANNEEELLVGISELAKNSDITGILVCDENSTRDRNPYRVTCRVASGVVEAVTEDSVSLWFNGELIRCSYKFGGKEQALLSRPELLKDKLMEFYFIQIGNTEYCIGKGIDWHSPKWKERRQRESGVWIEKCSLCGSTRHRHANRGVCKSCENNLHYYYESYGPDVWITPSRQMDKKRYNSVWKFSILNLVGYRYKGCTLEAREDGSWKFTKGE